MGFDELQQVGVVPSEQLFVSSLAVEFEGELGAGHVALRVGGAGLHGSGVFIALITYLISAAGVILTISI